MTCVVCGQLRPDLDLTLDDEDDDLSGGLGMGAAGASIKPTSVQSSEEASPAPTHVVMSTPVEIDPEAGAGSSPFRMDRQQNYVAMTELPTSASSAARRDRLSDRIGPILLIVAPLASAMAGGMTMLSKVEDFSSGAWYAVGSVFVAMLLATLFGGLLLSGFFFVARVRWTFLLRCIFLAVGIAVTWYGVTQLPRHVVVRENDFPGIVLPK